MTSVHAARRAPGAAPAARAAADRGEATQRMLGGVRAAGLKLTPQRIAIVRELAADESHPTAQELFDRLRPGLPTMSFATVYNTLAALSAAGLCASMSLTPGSGRFDPHMGPHDHLVCDGCGAVRDVPPDGRVAATVSSARRVTAKAAPGFELRAVERIFRGLCPRCARSAPRGGRARAAGPVAAAPRS